MTTQFARASYQEIVDLHTESDTVSVIGIHTPQGDTPRKMFGGFFDQFKKFKYLGCSISLVPAARLPADPLQVSYDAGEATIDPRDMLNPLMFHGCHGNDMGVILNRLYSLNSVDGRKSDSIVMEQDTTAWSLEGILAGEIPNFQLEDLYYKALTDNTWKKAHPQRGFRKSGLRPLVYKMSTNMQMLGSGQSLIGVDGLGIPGRMIGDDGDYSLPVVQSGRQFFTPGLTGLGWLDTRNVLTTAVDVDYDGSQYDDLDEAIPAIEKAIREATLAQQNASESSLPLVYMGMILLPPAYKTEQYFRMIINHHFAFKDFRGISFSNNLAVTPAYDNFNADATDDPDDPDPPSPPEPDPPIGGDVVLTVTGQGPRYQVYNVGELSSDFAQLAGTSITVDGGEYDGAVLTLPATYNNAPVMMGVRFSDPNGENPINPLFVGTGYTTDGYTSYDLYTYESSYGIRMPYEANYAASGNVRVSTFPSDVLANDSLILLATESVSGAAAAVLALLKSGDYTLNVV